MSEKSMANRFAPLLRNDLDVSDHRAQAAADILGNLILELVDWEGGLENAAEALQHSAPMSDRAKKAGGHLEEALNNCQELFCALVSSRNALDPHSDREPRS